ncbi:doublesex- and mab-3-related transcription factor C2 isoform X2 [Penaeus vannamei]|uniref:doublesex- and mab-3-related transcription factor C2 isoform X2 n=1 Tax=Penaeus vannamei TaxID=6689 RepID=UPI00387F9526
MAMAPKKKFDFFNGGRGVNMKDSFAEGCEGSLGAQHSKDIQSPTAYCDQAQADFQSSNSLAAHSPGDMGNPGAVNAEGVCWGNSTAEEDDPKKKKKRQQRCRLCANHGIYVEVKGHKWYCPYRDQHNCEKCEITRKRQYYMAEQQKLTREQQQQLQAQRVGGVPSSPPSLVAKLPSDIAIPLGPNIKPRDFPRLDELIQETANIINEELFEEINQVVRPRTHQ